jgi:NADPH:quinone reductase-like Zn-dependent oxidoreductase
VLPTGRVPLADGAGEVIAVGDDVDEFKVADTVVSAFYPYWLGGEMTPATKRDIPREHFDGYAREYVCMPAHAFTKAPAGYTQCGGGNAHLHGSHRLERPGGVRPGEAR